ncbi:hypothetical protein MYCOZU1_02552 [Mycobacterium intracellulare subsp. chimaera]|nr:hypothetical protein MYCODSM44623_02429 [Mycobacterium intracellulare subsp. chimaera]ASL20975.1 hypothetical protein MYCOZU1_02552 [Mycobacterium intracellulare subsp. chimaera]
MTNNPLHPIPVRGYVIEDNIRTPEVFSLLVVSQSQYDADVQDANTIYVVRP